MFRCQSCGVNTLPKTPATKIVTDTRERTYENPRVHENPDDPDDDSPIISKGWEIVREIMVCPACADTAKAF